MNIALLEPLGIDDELLSSLAKPLVDSGHTFSSYPLTHIDAQLIERAADAGAVIIGNRRFGDDIIEKLPNLRFLSVAFTGVDHVGLAACKKQGVAVSNAAGYATDSVAELAICGMLSILRRVTECDHRTREGGTKDGLVGNELSGKTVGVVGTGAIGLRVAELLRAFRCRVIAYAPRPKQAAIDMGIEYVPLDELMKLSDIVTLHVPLNDETKGMIDARRINLMKPSAILVNTARGPVVDYMALAIALRDGRVAGAAVDVFEKEPPIYPAHPMLQVRNVVCTPHVAFATKESLVKRAQIAFDNVYAWLSGERINIVL